MVSHSALHDDKGWFDRFHFHAHGMGAAGDDVCDFTAPGSGAGIRRPHDF